LMFLVFEKLVVKIINTYLLYYLIVMSQYKYFIYDE
jgi:hypothetical protein